MKAGFTGSQQGPTDEQATKFLYLLERYMLINPFTEFHHGCCIGSDRSAHFTIAHHKEFHPEIHIHPGDNPEKTALECMKTPGVKVYPVMPNLKRNLGIIKVSGIMFAMPHENSNVIRSGTWHTIRHTIRAMKWLHVIWPSGETNLYLPGFYGTPTYGIRKRVKGDEIVCGDCEGTGVKKYFAQPDEEACRFCSGRGYVIHTATGRFVQQENPPFHSIPPGA
jgi:hypothetical protein